VGDELEVVAGRDLDHAAAEALHTAIAGIALLSGASQEALGSERAVCPARLSVQ
jgi:hypothetical protein